MQRHKIGLDANLPIVHGGPQAGALSNWLVDPEVIAGTGTAWVRLNFVLGPWCSPTDSTLHQGRTWAETYGLIIDQFKARGLNIYGLVSHEAVEPSPPYFLREHRDYRPDPGGAQQWLDGYVRNFEQIVGLFRDRVTIFESFNEPDAGHGGHSHWLHPTWFAALLQAIHQRVKLDLGWSEVRLVSGPLQGFEINRNQSPMHYLRETYQYGKQQFGWAERGYPFDGVGYHLYLKEGFNPNWAAHRRELRQAYHEYVSGMLRVIRAEEGPTTTRQLYISEIGWPSQRNLDEDRVRQADVLRLELELLAQDPAVALGIWCCTEDSAPAHPCYGLYQSGDPSPQGRKPAYFAFQEVCQALSLAAPAEIPLSELDLPARPTNQNVINAFNRVSTELGLGPWGLLYKIDDLSPESLAQARSKLYTGPAIAALTGLSAAEKQKLHQALLAELEALTEAAPPRGGTRGEGTAKPRFLRLWSELAGTPLAPAASLQIDLSQAATSAARKVGGIWNRYGWLLLSVADQSGFDPGVAVAVLAIESGGRGFGGDGRMVLRFENHIFHKYWGQHQPDRFTQHFNFNPQRRWEKHQWRPSSDAAWVDFHGGQSQEWEVFTFANNLEARAAKLSISMGLPQIMGFNYAALGYGSVEEMFEAFASGDRPQLLGFFDFVCGPAADPRRLIALREQDFETFAALYNGPGQAARYGSLLSEACETFRSLRPIEA